MSELMLKSVYDLLDKNYFIPSYQRGYRWEKRQIQDLLEDFYSFARKTNKSNGSFYCLPYYWSAAGREIDVSKSICDNGNTVVLRCSVGSEKMTLIKDDTIIEILKYNACVTNKRRVKRFVNCIERRFNE